GEILRAHARTGAIRESQDLGLHARVLVQIGEEGFFGADRFLIPLRHHRALVDTRRALAHALRIAAEDGPQRRVRRDAQLAERAQVRVFAPFAELAPEPWKASYRQRIEHGAQVLRGDHGQPVWFLEVGGD